MPGKDEAALAQGLPATENSPFQISSWLVENLARSAETSECLAWVAQPDTSFTIIPQHTWLDYIGAFGPIAILLSALIAGTIAWRSIVSQRQMAASQQATASDIARKRASLDIITRLETDSYYHKISATFRDVRDAGRLAALLETKNQRDREEKQEVVQFLNHYELISVGMHNNILDEAFLYHWFRGAFLTHCHDARELMLAVQGEKKNDKVFAMYQLFADAWASDKFVTREDDPKEFQNLSNNVEIQSKHNGPV